MRTVQGLTRCLALVCSAALLVVAFLCGANVLPGFAASPAQNCAPPAPPPVAGSPVPAPAVPGSVLINEILTNPGSTWNCSEPPGSYSVKSDAWIELYNTQSQPYDLYVVHAWMDSGPNTPRFYLPLGAAIAPHGFLAVFPNSAMLLASSHVRLVFAIASTAIDQVSFPSLAINDSYARIPDGSTNWQITTTPTIDASNVASSSASGTSTPTPSQGSSSSSGSGGSSQATPTPALATGTQPAWSKLSLPSATATESPTTYVVNSPLTNAPTPTSGASDVQRRTLMTVLLVLLAGALFWCWKVYSS